jgi:hypothetical protein
VLENGSDVRFRGDFQVFKNYALLYKHLIIDLSWFDFARFCRAVKNKNVGVGIINFVPLRFFYQPQIKYFD